MKERPSPVEGTGLFADKITLKGEVVVQFRGERISKERADEIYSAGCDYLIQVSAEEFLFLMKTNARFLNHSCEPNTSCLNHDGELVALRNIKKDEEIFFDYSSNENTEFQITCLCGTKNCRKIIVPFNKLSPEDRAKILSIASPHIRALKLS